MLSFERYVGIGYSGAQTPTASLKGLHLPVFRSPARIMDWSCWVPTL